MSAEHKANYCHFILSTAVRVEAFVKSFSSSCTPGETVMDRCNTCICTHSSGLGLCTLMACPEGDVNLKQSIFRYLTSGIKTKQCVQCILVY